MRRVLSAAALCCGLSFSGLAFTEVLAPSGLLPKATTDRLLLVDAARIDRRVIAVGDRGYIVTTDDEGATWQRAKAPAAPLLTAVRFLDAKLGWAVGHDAVILATTDGGANWVQQFMAPAEQKPLLDVLFLDAQRGMAVGAYGAFYETADGGKTWADRKIVADDKHFNSLVRVADDKLLILGEAGTILTSADAGKTWVPVASPYKGSLFGAVIAADGSIVAFGLRGRIYRSTDGGKGWKQVDNASVATLMGGTRLPDGAIVLAGAAGTALISRDNGQSFQPFATGTTRALAKPLVGGANSVLFLGEAGPRKVPLPAAAAKP